MERTWSLQINTHFVVNRVLARVPKLFKGEIFSSNNVERTGYLHTKKWSWPPTLYTNVNSIWVKKLNLRAKTITLLEVIQGVHFCILEWCKTFLYTTLNHKWKKKKWVNWSNFKTFALQKAPSTWKDHPYDEKIVCKPYVLYGTCVHNKHRIFITSR